MTDDSIPTRASLLNRLKNPDDQQGWQEFVDTYRRLIHGVAVKAGLTEAEAQDVVQETVISVCATWRSSSTIRPSAHSAPGCCG